MRVLEITTENSERLGRQARQRIEPGISRLPAVRVQRLTIRGVPVLPMYRQSTSMLSFIIDILYKKF